MKHQSELLDSERQIKRFRNRLGVAGFFTIALFGILGARFAYLQVSQHSKYTTMAENNAITLVPTVPNRGLIYDRNGVVLARNFSGYSLEITPNKVSDIPLVIDQLNAIIPITQHDRNLFNKLRSESKNFESIPIKAHLTDDEVAKFAANAFRFPGVHIKARLFRQYPMGPIFSHVLGYIGRINTRDLKMLDTTGQLDNYKGTDHIGKTGIEQEYEQILHGQTGYDRVETDAAGHGIRTLSRVPPISGQNIYLTIDAKLQEIAYNALGDWKGAVVAISPKTGEVLAMVSKPGFDPNLFVDGIDPANWDALNNSPDHPLTDRTIRGTYPPGSTFKPYVALTGLYYNTPLAHQTMYDPGFFQLPGQSHQYRDDKKGGHGTLDIVKAIIVSCDTYFYRLAYSIGVDNIANYVGQFGFGHKTGIDLPGEKAGILPTQEWKQKRYHVRWFPGETVITGIGQGYNLYTPLQLAVAISTLANHGQKMKPHLLLASQNPKTNQKVFDQPEKENLVPIRPADYDMVQKAMIGVTQPGGTAQSIGRNLPYSMAAKTGTAQVIGIKQGEKWHAGSVERKHHDHALFIAYAPVEDPKIAVAVIAENGDWGATTAGPIAKAVIDYYLLHKLPPAPAQPGNKPGATTGQATTGQAANGQAAPAHPGTTAAAQGQQPGNGRTATPAPGASQAPEPGVE